MTRLGVFVGEDKWQFFTEIFDDLRSRYQTEVYRRKGYRFPLLRRRINQWAARKRMRNMLRRNDICFFEWAGELLVAASHLPKSCVIVTRLHSFELYAWATKINWDAVDKVILVSRAMERRFAELYPAHAGKTEVIYNGVAIDRFTPRFDGHPTRHVGTVCRITPIKRVYELVLTCYALRARGQDVHLHVAGAPDGDQRYAAAIERLIDKLDMRRSVHLDGQVTDIPAWLQQIDVFVSNSFWEAHQVALVEAMAAGCYCLAHSWDGADEILPSANLYTTDAELQQKLLEYWDLAEAEQQARRRSMRRLVEEKFGIDQQILEMRRAVESSRPRAV